MIGRDILFNFPCNFPKSFGQGETCKLNAGHTDYVANYSCKFEPTTIQESISTPIEMFSFFKTISLSLIQGIYIEFNTYIRNY